MKSTKRGNGMASRGKTPSKSPTKPAADTRAPDTVGRSGKNGGDELPSGGTEARTDRHAVLQRDLERFPWSRLSDDRGEQAQLQLLLDEAGIDGRAWVVTQEDKGRLPGPFDADVYIALSQLFNSQVPKAQRPDQRTVHTTISELAGIMRRERGGTTYKAIRDSLLRLRRTEIRAVRTFRDGEIVAEERIFNVLGEVRFGYRRDGDRDRTAVAIEFPLAIAESIARGNFRLLDVGRYFALGTPTARRLFRYLDYRRWRGKDRQNEFAIPLRQLAQELPIDRDAPAHIKRTLDSAHAELIDQRYLSAAEYDERPVQGKKRGVWWVTYHFADAPPALTGAPAKPLPVGGSVVTDPKEDPDYLREMVAEILGVLRDGHSTAFYAKCAKAFERDALLNILGGVRQAITEGMGLEMARKTFTATAKTRARAMGVEL